MLVKPSTESIDDLQESQASKCRFVYHAMMERDRNQVYNCTDLYKLGFRQRLASRITFVPVLLRHHP